MQLHNLDINVDRWSALSEGEFECMGIDTEREFQYYWLEWEVTTDCPVAIWGSNTLYHDEIVYLVHRYPV